MLNQIYRKYYVPLVLFLSLIFIYLIPKINFLSTYAVFSAIGFLSVIWILAYFARSKIDKWLTFILIFSLISSRLIFNKVDQYTLLFRDAAVLSFILLHFVLCIGPWSHFSKIFLHFYKHRRHLGVTAFLLGFLHGSLIFNLYFNYSLSNAFQSVFVFFGFTALFIMFWLALTSWDYVQKHVSLLAWKIIHAVILIIYGGFVWYLLKVAGEVVEPWQKVTLGLFGIFWILVAPWSLPKKILSYVNGWKQLHVLVYIAYVATIIHVWVGIISEQDTWLKVLFWILVGLVFISHAIGWVVMFKEYLKNKSRRYAKLIIDDKTYYELDTVASFTPGLGRLFNIAGLALAVYKFNDKVYALSNRCAHQGGPIAEGKIVRGYVVCPWHRYAFHLDDGCGPPGFPDCIPKYPTIIKDGKVYVALTPVKEKRTA